MLFLDFYAHRSAMYPCSAQLKLWMTLVPLLLCVSADSIAFSLIILVSMIFIAVPLAKTPAPVFIRFLMLPFTFALLSCVGIAIQVNTSATEQGVSLLGLHWFVTSTSVLAATKLFCKAFACVSCLLTLALTTPSDEIISFLQKCKFPRIFTELMTMVYRFIFLLLDIQATLRSAANARLGNNGFKVSCKTWGAIFLNLFILAIRRTSSIFDAMLSRGYSGTLAFLEPEKKSSVLQKAVLGIYFLFLIICFIFFQQKGLYK